MTHTPGPYVAIGMTVYGGTPMLNANGYGRPAVCYAVGPTTEEQNANAKRIAQALEVTDGWTDHEFEVIRELKAELRGKGERPS